MSNNTTTPTGDARQYQNFQQSAAPPQQQYQPHQQQQYQSHQQQQYQPPSQQQYQPPSQQQYQSPQPDTQIALQNSPNAVMVEFMRLQQEQARENRIFQEKMLESMNNLAIGTTQQPRPLPVSQEAQPSAEAIRAQMAATGSRLSAAQIAGAHQIAAFHQPPPTVYPPPSATPQYNQQYSTAPVQLPSHTEAECLKILDGMYKFYNDTLEDVTVEIPQVTQDIVNSMLYYPSCTPGWQTIRPLLEQARERRRAHLAGRRPLGLADSIHSGQRNQGQQQQFHAQQQQPLVQQQQSLFQQQQPLFQQQQPLVQQQQPPVQQQQSRKGKGTVHSGHAGLGQSVHSNSGSSVPRPMQQAASLGQHRESQQQGHIPSNQQQTAPPSSRPQKLTRRQIKDLRDDEPDYQQPLRNQQPQQYRPPPKYAGKFDVHPDDRPGGLLPVPPYRCTRRLNDNEYPRTADRPDEPNAFYMRNSLLNLAADEHQYPCWGVYGLTDSNADYMRCPYILDPAKCRNSHKLQQAVVDFVVGKRGITHRTVRNLITSIKLTGVSNIPEIRVPSFLPAIGLTPNQERRVRDSQMPGPTPSEAANMPLPGPSAQPGAPRAQEPETPAGTRKWNNYASVIDQDDRAKMDHAQNNPPTRTPQMHEKYKWPGGTTTRQVHQSVPLRHQPTVIPETSSAPPAAAAPSGDATQQPGVVPETSSAPPAAAAPSSDAAQQSGVVPETPARPSAATVAPSASVTEAPDHVHSVYFE